MQRQRRSIRLKEYDYSISGAYFVTICSFNRECLFGNVVDGRMDLNPYGQIVQYEWLQTATIRPNVELDTFVVMPNHFHGIIMIRRGTARRAPTFERFGCPVAGSLPTIVRSFKSAVTKGVNDLRRTSGVPVWQHNYYEHVIRDENDLNQIRQYIRDNLAQWALDLECA